MSVLHQFQPILPKPSLITLYKTFIGIQFDYADVTYDQACFHEKLVSIQYNACLAITGTTGGISMETYQKIGFKYHELRRCLRKLCYFYNIFTEKSPSYLFNLTPRLNKNHNI